MPAEDWGRAQVLCLTCSMMDVLFSCTFFLLTPHGCCNGPVMANNRVLAGWACNNQSINQYAAVMGAGT